VNGVTVTFAVPEGVICTSGRCCCSILLVWFPAPIDPPYCLFSSTHQRVLRMCSLRFSLGADDTRKTPHQKQRAAGGSQCAVRLPGCAPLVRISQPGGGISSGDAELSRELFLLQPHQRKCSSGLPCVNGCTFTSPCSG
jgi:hypothetical protein